MPFKGNHVNVYMGRDFTLEVDRYSCGHYDGDAVTYIKMNPHFTPTYPVRTGDDALVVLDVPCFICPDCGDTVYSLAIEWVIVRLRANLKLTGEISFGEITSSHFSRGIIW